MKYYTTDGPRREMKVIAINTRVELITVQNPDGTTQDLQVENIYFELKK